MSIKIDNRQSANEIYGLRGSYGGNQKLIEQLVEYRLSEKEVLLDQFSAVQADIIISLIKKYFPNASKTDTKNIAYIFTNNGCGFIGLANHLCNFFANLQNGEEIFKNNFGIDLYYVINGQKFYNINCLAIELFLRYSIMFSSTKNIKDIISYGVHNIIFDNRGMEVLLATCGVDFKQYQSSVSISFIEQAIRNGAKYFSLYADDFRLRAIGNTSECHFEAGHGMTITGINDNGNLIVSSWGKEYELTWFKDTPLTRVTVMDFKQLEKDPSTINEIIDDFSNKETIRNILKKVLLSKQT